MARAAATTIATRSGRTSTAAPTRTRVPRLARRTGRLTPRGRVRARRPMNHGLVAGRAPMTAIARSARASRLGRRRATAGGDGEAGGRLEVGTLLDLDGGDLVAEPIGLLAGRAEAPLAEIALPCRVHPAPAGLVTRSSL